MNDMIGPVEINWLMSAIAIVAGLVMIFHPVLRNRIKP